MSKTKPEKMPAGYFGWLLLDGEQGCVVLKDALRNLSASENGDNHEYSKGLLVGVLSMLVASGMELTDAEQLVWQCLPNDCHYERFPEVYRTAFSSRIARSTIPTMIRPADWQTHIVESGYAHMDRRQADMAHKDSETSE